MPFHVQVRQSFRRAWAFNLDDERLRRTVIEPWRSGSALALGDREWDPRESTLLILEGPELSPPDLAFGRGWQNAERSGRDVTVALMSTVARQAATVSVLAASPSAERVMVASLDRIGVHAVEWAEVRERILAATGLTEGHGLDRIELVATFLALDDSHPDGSWLFEAGLAMGALGRRAIIAQLGHDPLPPELRGVDAIRLDVSERASLEALRERLRDAGYPFESG
jgi:hypothetical protein